MKITEAATKDMHCWTCRGKPDFAYFDSETKEILYIICQSCRDTIEGSIRAIGRSFCTDPGCEDCGRSGKDSA